MAGIKPSTEIAESGQTGLKGMVNISRAPGLSGGKEGIEDYNGLYSTNPRLSLLMLIALFSLAGIPPVAGFFGKFFLYTAAAEKGYYILVFIAVVNATVSLYYYLLIIKAMFINKSDNPIAHFNSNLPMRISLVICLVGMLAVGFVGGIFDHLALLSQHYLQL